MKNPKKVAIKIISLCLSLILFMSVSPTVYAVDNVPSGEQITPRIDETEWVIRTYNGKIQKRLWSYTEGKWLTDWIDIGIAA